MSGKDEMDELILQIGDKFPGLLDEEIKQILDMKRAYDRRLRRQRRPRRSGSEGDNKVVFSRENALWALRKLRISQDPQVRLIRQVNEQARKYLAADVIRQAKAWLPHKSIADYLGGGTFICLPGDLLGAQQPEVLMPLSKCNVTDRNAQTLLDYTLLTASRICREHWIEPRSAFLFLLTEEGFEQRKPVSSEFEERSGRPGMNQIILKIDPWTTPEVVASEYAKARNQYGYGKLRLPHQRTLALVLYMASLFDVFGKDVKSASWHRMLRAWRVVCRVIRMPGWAYGREKPPLSKDLHRFARDVKRAFQILDDTFDPREKPE